MENQRILNLLFALLLAVFFTPSLTSCDFTEERQFEVVMDYQVMNGDLRHPWGLAFLPSGKMLVTERSGYLRVVEPGGASSPPLRGVPKVRRKGQGGLLEAARQGVLDHWVHRLAEIHQEMLDQIHDG